MGEVFTIWAEWDLGINSNIYASYALAEKHLSAALEEHADMTLEQAIAHGLAGIECKDLIEE